jgi:hypothetical protein
VTAGAIIWAGLLIALIVLFVAVTRRMSILIARTRELERLQRSVESIDLRLGAAVDPLVARLDGLRRHAGDVEGLARDLVSARAMLLDLAAEARALQVPASLAAQGAAMVHETDRAVRAADLVTHGMDAMLAARGVYEGEAQTSLKRGALNLRHAREVFGRVAAEIAALRPADLAPGAGGASGGGATSPVPRGGTTYGDAGDADVEGPFEPRM